MAEQQPEQQPERQPEQQPERERTPLDAVSRAVQANWLFARLPPWIIDTLSTEQTEALHLALDDQSWDRPPINIRIGLPWFARRYYLTVIAGEEARSIERRADERHRYPLRTLANLFFFVGIATVFFMIALIALAFGSAIVEF